jgi:hypothetical protein
VHVIASTTLNFGKRFFLQALLVASLSPVLALHADSVLSSTTPPSGATTTNACSGCLFNYVAAPTSTVGQAVTYWSFYALSTKPVTPVIFNVEGVVVGVGSPVTPKGIGVQTAERATRHQPN